MTRTFNRVRLAQLAVVVMAGLALAPAVEAADKRGGGGGGARASGGGGAKQKAQVNNSKQDKRTNNVRNTSVNNVNNSVNVNKNVNVNVDNDRHGWDNDYHPVATAAAVGGGRLDRQCATAGLRAGQLRRHHLPAVRQHLVPAAGYPVRGDQPAVLRYSPPWTGPRVLWPSWRQLRTVVDGTRCFRALWAPSPGRGILGQRLQAEGWHLPMKVGAGHEHNRITPATDAGSGSSRRP